MKLTKAALLAVCFILSLAAWSRAADVSTVISEADHVYGLRSRRGMAREAAVFYRLALSQDPGNFEAGWKLCRALHWAGTHEKAKAQKLAFFREGRQVADMLVRSRPRSVAGYYYRALFNARILALTRDPSLLFAIRKDLDRSLALDPIYDGGAPYWVLGGLYAKLPWYAGGDLAKGVAALEKAVAVGPRRLRNHVYLAQAYLEAGKVKKAHTILAKVLARSPEPGSGPEFEEWRSRARRLLQNH